MSGLRFWWWRRMERARLLRDSLGDWRRYARHAILSTRSPRRAHLQTLLRKECHRMEKGLAMRSPRPGFGQGAAHRLAQLLQTSLERYDRDRLTDMTGHVLQRYLEFQRQQGMADLALESLLEQIRRQFGMTGVVGEGGDMPVTREDIWRNSRLDLRGFFESRYSIRHFAPGGVDPALIRQAVALAQKTPSVCNRQNWKAYAFFDPALIADLLTWQNGNRGFGDQVTCLLLLTADLEGFINETERHQAWVDGGMFAMSVIYALHSLGLGTCCLNLCQNQQADRAVRRLGSLPDNEVLLMMLAVGHLPETLNVACSPRKTLEEVLVIKA
jgi:nitroreductase